MLTSGAREEKDITKPLIKELRSRWTGETQQRRKTLFSPYNKSIRLQSILLPTSKRSFPSFQVPHHDPQLLDSVEAGTALFTIVSNLERGVNQTVELMTTVTRLQKYSTYAFTIFASFHITNTSIIPLVTRSVPASEPYLLLTRPYYQSFPLEPLLVTLPIATHSTLR